MLRATETYAWVVNWACVSLIFGAGVVISRQIESLEGRIDKMAVQQIEAQGEAVQSRVMLRQRIDDLDARLTALPADVMKEVQQLKILLNDGERDRWHEEQHKAHPTWKAQVTR